MKNIFFIMLFLSFTLNGLAQTTLPVQQDLIKGGYYGSTKVIVKLDPLSRIPVGNIPFDKNFILRIYVKSLDDLPQKVLMETGNVDVEDVPFYNITNPGDYDSKDDNFKILKYGVDIVVAPLQPNKKYSFYFINSQEKELETYLQIFYLIYKNKIAEAEKIAIDFKGESSDIPVYDELKRYYDQHALSNVIKKNAADYEKSKIALLKIIKDDNTYTNASNEKVQIFQNVIQSGRLSTNQFSVEASSAFSLVADAGVVFMGFQKGFNSLSSYVGINYSFRPLDSDIPFSYLVRNRRISFFQRFSINLGLTLNSIAKTGYRGNIFGSNNIMGGFGFKFSHVVSLNAGGVLYNNIDPNPLIDKKTMGLAPYVSLSFNLKIKQALGDLSKIFTYAK